MDRIDRDKDSYQPLVSVIMNCYNGEAYVAEAIDSVLAQTYQNWQLIFWDNQSTDQTANIVAGYKDQRIKYFYAPSFTTLGEARNLAIGRASGDLIAFLDSDDIWLREKLSSQVPLFDNENVGIVISDTIFFNNAGAQRQLYRNKKPPSGKVFRELLQNYFISLETAVVRRAAIETLDEIFDPRFSAIEEYDLFVRLSHAWELHYVDAVLAKWRVHGASWTWTRASLFGAERRLFLEKLEAFEPNLRQLYAGEYKNLIRICDFEDACVLWRRGNLKEARQLLTLYKFSGVRWAVVYALSFFPYRVFSAVERLRRIRPS